MSQLQATGNYRRLVWYVFDKIPGSSTCWSTSATFQLAPGRKTHQFQMLDRSHRDVEVGPVRQSFDPHMIHHGRAPQRDMTIERVDTQIEFTNQPLR